MSLLPVASKPLASMTTFGCALVGIAKSHLAFWPSFPVKVTLGAKETPTAVRTAATSSSRALPRCWYAESSQGAGHPGRITTGLFAQGGPAEVPATELAAEHVRDGF